LRPIINTSLPFFSKIEERKIRISSIQQFTKQKSMKTKEKKSKEKVH
jgi:hypothetical protein